MSDFGKRFDEGLHGPKTAADYRDGSPEWQGAMQAEALRRQAASNEQAGGFGGGYSGGGNVGGGHNGSGGYSDDETGPRVVAAVIIFGLVAALLSLDDAIMAVIFLLMVVGVAKVAADFEWSDWIKYPAIIAAILLSCFMMYSFHGMHHPPGSVIEGFRAHWSTILVVIGGGFGGYVFFRDEKLGDLGLETGMKCALGAALVIFGLYSGGFREDSSRSTVPQHHSPAQRYK